MGEIIGQMETEFEGIATVGSLVLPVDTEWMNN